MRPRSDAALRRRAASARGARSRLLRFAWGLVACLLLGPVACTAPMSDQAREDFLEEADARLMGGATEEAEAIFLKVLRAHPGDARALAGTGLVALRRGDIVDALTALDGACTAAPENAHYALLRAGALARLDRIDEAIAALDGILVEHPDHGDAAILLIDLLQKAGRRDEAADVAREAARRSPRNAPLLVKAGQVLQARGAITEALECFDTARRVAHWAPEPVEGMIDALVGVGRESEASRLRPVLQDLRRRAGEVEALRAAAVFDSGDPGPSLAFVRRLFDEGRLDEAMLQTRVFLRQFPVDPSGGALAVLATQGAVRAGDADAALQFVAIARQRGEFSDDDRITLAAALNALEHHQEAATMLEPLARIMPDHPGVLSGLARADIGLGDLEKAGGLLDHALEIDPDNAHALAAMALLRLKQRDLEGSESAGRRALEKDPSESDAHLAVGLVEHQRGDLAAAERSLRTVLALRPADHNARSVLALVLSDQDRCEEAIPYFTVAIDQDFSNATLHAGLVRCYEALGRTAEAEEARRTAAAILGAGDPNGR